MSARSLLSRLLDQGRIRSSCGRQPAAAGSPASEPALARDNGSGAQTRRFLGGRQPLCGSGVTSSMALIESPEAWMSVMALSRPDPGPLTLTSTSLTPYFVAVAAAVSAARCAANGVLLRLPLNPTVPDEAQHNASPLGSVIVTVVLLNVALMCTTARLTLRRVFRFLALATAPVLLNQSDPINALVVLGSFTIMPRVSGTHSRLEPGSTRCARILGSDHAGPGGLEIPVPAPGKCRGSRHPTATAPGRSRASARARGD